MSVKSHNKRGVHVECVCQSPRDAAVASSYGADRIELCQALVLGGLTPSLGTVRAVRAACTTQLMVMIRPRSGGCAYSRDEVATMIADVKLCVDSGADGVVFGALTPDGQLDDQVLMELIAAADGATTCVHRAFDGLSDWKASLDRLIALGVDRVLTSGGAPRAIDACDAIADRVRYAADRIEVVACGGVRPETMETLIRRTGVTAVHMAPLTTSRDTSMSHTPNLAWGAYGDTHDVTYPVLDGAVVAQACAWARRASQGNRTQTILRRDS